MANPEIERVREEASEELFNHREASNAGERGPEVEELVTGQATTGEEFAKANVQMGPDRDVTERQGDSEGKVTGRVASDSGLNIETRTDTDNESKSQSTVGTDAVNTTPSEDLQSETDQGESLQPQIEGRGRSTTDTQTDPETTETSTPPGVDPNASGPFSNASPQQAAPSQTIDDVQPAPQASTETPNLAPSDLSLSADSIGEDAAGGTVVAELSATDSDAGETFTYSINGDPSGMFTIDGDRLILRPDASLDFETDPSHELTIEVSDSAGNSFEKTVNVDVTDVNETPTQIVLDGGSVQENAAGGTVVANLSAVDQDTGESFTYELTNDASGLFEIVGDQVQIKPDATLDFEANPTHELTIEVSDSAGNSFAKTVNVDVTNVNETPTQIVLDGGSVQENAAGGTVVANLSAVDQDTGESFTYELTNDASGLFEIVGDQVQIKPDATLDFEANPTHELTIEVSDSAGNSFAKTVNVDVTDVNETPTQIVLDGGSVQENAAGGTVVAKLSTADQDAGESFTYELTSDASGLFEIVGDQVQVKPGAAIDFESATSHEIDIKVTDTGGNAYTQSITLNVDDVAESVPGITLTGSNNSDHLVGTVGDDTIDGRRGNDTLEGGAGDDTFKVHGDAGYDQYDGGTGHDTIQGGRYNDTIRIDDNLDNIQNIEAIDGGAGYDVLQAGSGNDTIDLSNGPALSNIEEIDGGAGNDHIIGTSGNDHIEGNRGNDILEGGAGDDTFKVHGDAGYDQYDGGTGHDTIQGGRYNDTIRIDDNLDNIQNIEAIDGGAGYDVLQAGSGNDTIDLSNGPALSNIEEIDGGAGNDHIIGSSGDDRLDGNRGDDVLEGGAGNDEAYGGSGNDTYVFGMEDGHDSFHGGSGWTDVIQLDANGASDPDNPWTIEINNEVVEFDMAARALELSPDSSGTITMEDGSQLDFDGVDKIVW